MIEDRDVETGEMEELEHFVIRKQAREIRRSRIALCDLHEVGVPIAARELDEAKPVAVRVEAERLGVDRDHRAGLIIGRQIAMMEAVSHELGLRGKALGVKRLARAAQKSKLFCR